MPDLPAPAFGPATLDLFDRPDAAGPSPRAAALMAPVPGLDAGFVHEARPGYADPPAPFYASPDDSLRLYQADALDLLRRMRDESVDMIFADPPYFLSNGGITCVNGRMVKVDKGGWDKSTGITGDHNFNLLWLDQCRRILKPNGTIWVTGTSHNIHSVGYGLQVLDYKILNDIAWYKVNPPPNLACRYFTHATETILWAAKSAKSRHTFNYPLMKEQNGGKQMQSLWSITPPGKSEKRFGKHPTQKPEALLWRIIAASTHPGELVLDPFCGSATTGVACARLGRRFIGIERETEHLELAQKRLQEEYDMQKQRLDFDKYVIPLTGIGGGGVEEDGARRRAASTSAAYWNRFIRACQALPAGHGGAQQGLGRPRLRSAFGAGAQLVARTQRRKLGTQASLSKAHRRRISHRKRDNGDHHAFAATRLGPAV